MRKLDARFGHGTIRRLSPCLLFRAGKQPYFHALHPTMLKLDPLLRSELYGGVSLDAAPSQR